MANQLDLGEGLSEALSSYSDELLKDIKVVLKEEAEELVNSLKEASPKKTGKYSRGWTMKPVSETNLSVSYVVYNKNQYQKAHLLEYGHANKDGSRTEGIAHIAPAEEAIRQEIFEKIESLVSKS